jgi:hypothetical protein
MWVTKFCLPLLCQINFAALAVRLDNFGSFAFFVVACRVGKMQMCQNLGGKALVFWILF